MITNHERCLICGRFNVTETGIYHQTCIRRFYGTPNFQDHIPAMDELSADIADQKVLVNLSGKRKSWNSEGGNRQYYFNFPGEVPFECEISDLHMLTAKHFGVIAAETALYMFSENSQPVQVVHRPAVYKKLKGSYLSFEEQPASLMDIGKWIMTNSSNPGIDAIRFFERITYSLLTSTKIGHRDFMIMKLDDGTQMFAPAFRFQPKAGSASTHELTSDIPLSGVKNGIGQGELLQLANELEIHPKAREATFLKFKSKRAAYTTATASSLLPDWLQEQLNGRFIQGYLKLGLM